MSVNIQKSGKQKLSNLQAISNQRTNPVSSEFHSQQSLESLNKSFQYLPQMENMQDADNAHIRESN